MFSKENKVQECDTETSLPVGSQVRHRLTRFDAM